MDMSSESDDDDYKEEPYVYNSLITLCLFCDHTETGNDEMIEHINTHHSIDIFALVKQFKLDSFLYIKLINFIREKGLNPEDLDQVLKSDEWKSNKYMIPHISNDSLLLIDVEDESDDEYASNLDQNKYAFINNCKQIGFQEELKERTDASQHSLKDGYSNGCLKTNTSSINSDNDSDDREYFSGYADFDIHYEMLSDKVRTIAYRDAILKYKSFIQGKHLLDVGCGTGILSLFAASQTDPKSITAVDQSEIIYYAMSIAEENSLFDKIQFKKGKLEKLKLDQKFDVIVSEWMGYFLLFEGMLDTFLWARDNLLNDGGLLLPSRCKIFVAGIEDAELSHRYNFWDNVYGFKMISIKMSAQNEVIVDVVNSKKIVTDTIQVKSLNLRTCSLEESQNIQTQFEFTCSRSSQLNAIVAWFDCYFDDSDESEITLTTSPYHHPTHWKQCILLLEEPIQVTENQKLKCTLKIARKKRNLNIHLTVVDKKMTYSMKG